MIFRLLFSILLLSLFTSAHSQPLVGSDWLAKHLADKKLVILDLQEEAGYRQHHIPGAIHTDYAKWRQEINGIPKVLPPLMKLTQLIGQLGIDNTRHVVLVPFGQNAGDMARAARVYWTLKALGHAKVSILDGGLIAYASQRIYPLERGYNKPLQKQFVANFNPDFVPDAAAVLNSLKNGAIAVDNRSRAEFLGIYRGADNERPGSLPNSKHLAYDWLTANGGGKIQNLENIRKLFAAAEIAEDSPQIHYCHTGHRASLGWFVAHELLGNKKAKLYDASTVEWAVDPNLPLEQYIDIQFDL